jgi:enoyl-CoA hydratase/carnithine racemase
LVAEVVSVAKLESRALELAQRFAQLPRENAALIKLAVWGGLELPLGEGLSLERRLAYRLSMLCGHEHGHDRGQRGLGHPRKPPRR